MTPAEQAERDELEDLARRIIGNLESSVDWAAHGLILVGSSAPELDELIEEGVLSRVRALGGGVAFAPTGSINLGGTRVESSQTAVVILTKSGRQVLAIDRPKPPTAKEALQKGGEVLSLLRKVTPP